MCGGRGLPLPLAMLGEIQLTLPIAARACPETRSPSLPYTSTRSRPPLF